MRAALREARTLPTSVGRVNLRIHVRTGSPECHTDSLTGAALPLDVALESSSSTVTILVARVG